MQLIKVLPHHSRLRSIIILTPLLTFFSCIGPSERDIPILIKQLSHKESSVRNQAALQLGSLGPKAHPAVSALARALGDDNGGVRSSAAYALRRIDTKEARRALDRYNH